MKLIDWQVYWPAWYRLYPSWFKTKDEYADFYWYDYWLGFSALQFRFRSKLYPNRIFRSPEWSENIKKLLLDDLTKQTSASTESTGNAGQERISSSDVH